MCGIFGYLGKRPDAAKIVFEGLKRLEYRGYDSWGIAVKVESQSRKSKLIAEKHVGAIGELDKDLGLPSSFIGIGHTRWATHGGVTEANAHPHYSSDKSFVLAQNGMVENFDELKRGLLAKGYKFKTQTDTEVIVRLIEEESKDGLVSAVRKAFLELDGRNTIILLTKEGQIIAARNGSPLVVGRSSDGDYYFSSDTLSFANLASDVFVVDNGQIVVGDGSNLSLFDIRSGKKRPIKFEKIGFFAQKAEKEGFEHFMMKEIFDTPEVIKTLFLTSRGKYLELVGEIKKARNIYTIGSGTAGAAAAQTAYFLRQFSKINAVSLVGADAYEYITLIKKGDLVISPSQSGETADVLEVLEALFKKGVTIASYVNMPGSMMTKISDFPFMANAGAEICVMSTKVFVSQIAWGYLISKAVAGEFEDAEARLLKLSGEIGKYLHDKNTTRRIRSLAAHLFGAKDIFLLAKAQNYQIIREGMIKLIEATYKHAHAIAAGDLKHYAITLMEKGVPVIVVASNDSVKSDVLSAVSQVKARGAEVIGFAPFDFKDFDFAVKVPDLGEVSSIFNVLPFQLLAYYLAIELGNNVDRPRNIAKSVTVK